MTITVIVLVFFYLIISIRQHHPFNNKINKLLQSYRNSLSFGALVQIYDLSTPNRTDRLFIIAPENVILYNYDKTLYYYLDSANVFCPNEYTVTTFTTNSIQTINDTGVYSTICTSIGSLSLVEHFVSSKNNVPDYTIVFDIANKEIQYSILDVINYLIYNGFVNVSH